jgi:5-methylcytosine-specific restriction endonuclease McrA
VPYADPERKRAYQAAYRVRPGNRETAAARTAAWRAANPERVAAWRTANAAKRSAQHAAWAAAHREELKAYDAAYHVANAAAIRKRHVATDKARYVADPAPFYANNRKRRARQFGASGAHTVADLQARWAMWGDRCWMCGDQATATDHVKALVRGGSNWPANLRPICQPCNSRKGSGPRSCRIPLPSA